MTSAKIKHTAKRYLIPDFAVPWDWAENGEVLIWITGETIAFRAELELVLRRLADQNIPSFPHLILFFAAMRGQEFLKSICISPKTSSIWFVPQNEFRHLYSLPDSTRSDTQAKVEIAEMVFEANKSRIGPELAQEIVRVISEGVGEQSTIKGFSENWSSLFPANLEIPEIDLQQLENRMRTGIDEIPEPTEIELPKSVRVQQLLDQIRDDDELPGIAGLATDLMATISLPRKQKRSEDLPAGGFADITNRGQFDRLLISELANDDLTLMTRLALNEAMYLRRESPPSNDQDIRLMLLHPGIRAWGLPRVYELSVALAILATMEDDSEVVAYRASEHQCPALELTTRENIVKYLEVLETELHPGAAIEAFVEHWHEVESTLEPLLILERSEFHDLEFQQALSNSTISFALVILVDREGHFELARWSKTGVESIRKSRMSLEKLLGTSSKNLSDEPNEFPAIIDFQDTCPGEAAFPILLPHPLSDSFCRLKPGAALAVSNDRRLMYWMTSHGGFQISDELPQGRLVDFTRDPYSQTCYLVFGHRRKYQMVVFREQHWELECLELGENLVGLKRLIAHRGHVIALTARFMILLDPATGETTDSKLISHETSHCNSRFFLSLDQQDCFAVHVSQGKLSKVPLKLSQRFHPKLISKLIESPENESIFAIRQDGNVIDVSRGKLIKTEHQSHSNQTVSVSKDSTRAYFENDWKWQFQYTIDDQGIQYQRVRGDIEERDSIAQDRALRKKFRAVAVHDQQLVLKSRNNQLLTFRWQGTEIVFTPRAVKVQSSELDWLEFESESTSKGYELGKVVFHDGSQIFLDSRGLLHLKSANREMAEVTLVLNEGQTSGWVQGHGVWGSPYFVGKSPSLHATQAYHEYILPLIRQLS